MVLDNFVQYIDKPTWYEEPDSSFNSWVSGIEKCIFRFLQTTIT